MTPTQRQALDFINAFSLEHHYSPTLEEICAHLGWKAKSGAHRVVSALIDRGYVRREGGCRSQRNLVVVHKQDRRSPLAAFTTNEIRAELRARGEIA